MYGTCARAYVKNDKAYADVLDLSAYLRIMH